MCYVFIIHYFFLLMLNHPLDVHSMPLFPEILGLVNMFTFGSYYPFWYYIF